VSAASTSTSDAGALLCPGCAGPGAWPQLSTVRLSVGAKLGAVEPYCCGCGATPEELAAQYGHDEVAPIGHERARQWAGGLLLCQAEGGWHR
jgi:hypothetical protein